MFNIGGGELFAILLLALIVLGPERLPKAMGQVGRYVAQLRRMSAGFQDEIRRAIDLDDAPFRPGEETLKGPVPAIEDEVRVVSREPDDTGNTPSTGPDDHDAVVAEADATTTDTDTDTADDAADQGKGSAEPAEATSADGSEEPTPEGNVTPLRPRHDGDARATG